MATVLRIAAVVFFAIAVVGFFWTLPMPALTAVFFGLMLLFGGELLARLGKGK